MIDPAQFEQIFERPGTGPLAGIVVADLSRVLAGPYATMLLADLGALVVKIESRAGDDTRGWVPPVREDESTYFLSINRNKYSIALDLADPVDLEIAQRIVARAEVVVENFKPGGLGKYGLDYKSVAAARSDVVYASISGFGQANPDLPGYDLVTQAVSGLMDLTGDPAGPPTKVGVALVDVITGLHTALGILAALRVRDETGVGTRVEVDLLSSILSGLVNQASAFVAGATVPTRMGNAHPSIYPYEPLPTADRDMVIAVGNDGQFARLCAVLGIPEVADDERYSRMAARNTHRHALRDILVERLATRSAEAWFHDLRAAGIPAGPILGIDGGIRLAEELGLQPIAATGRGARVIPTVRHPVGYSTVEVDYSQAPPTLDGDRARVLRWLEDDQSVTRP